MSTDMKYPLNNQMPELYWVSACGTYGSAYDCAVEEWDPFAQEYAENTGEAPPEEHGGILRSFRLNNPQHLRELADYLESFLDAPETLT